MILGGYEVRENTVAGASRRHDKKAMNESISFVENERFTSTFVNERIIDDEDKIVDGHKHEGSML